MTKSPHQPQDKYVLRMPDGMRDRLRDAAAENNRSMNAEIVDRLEWSFGPFGHIRLPDGYAERLASARGQKRLTIDSELMSYAANLIEHHLPKADDAMHRIQNSFENLIGLMGDITPEQKKRLWEDFDRLMETVHIETLDSE